MLVLYFHPVSKLLLFWGFFANTSVHITPAGLKVLQLNADKRQIILSVHSYIHSKTLNCANSHLDVSHLKGTHEGVTVLPLTLIEHSDVSDVERKCHFSVGENTATYFSYKVVF